MEICIDTMLYTVAHLRIAFCVCFSGSLGGAGLAISADAMAVWGGPAATQLPG